LYNNIDSASRDSFTARVFSYQKDRKDSHFFHIIPLLNCDNIIAMIRSKQIIL